MMWLAVSILACMAQLALAAYAPDRITSLPGWDGALPSKQYSGYLNVSGTASHLHYWFVESEEVDPATAPTLLWLNGGEHEVCMQPSYFICTNARNVHGMIYIYIYA